MSKTNNVLSNGSELKNTLGPALKNGYKLAFNKHPKLLISTVVGTVVVTAGIACGWSAYALLLTLKEDSY